MKWSYLMAIWDTAATKALNCPTCGDALKFDSAIKASVCRSCGNVYEAGTLNITGKLKFVDVDEASEEEENKREYVCGSCGATVVTNENTALTYCAFCGSPSVMGRRLAKEFRPDYMIPFKVEKDEAVRIFTNWVKNENKYTPGDLLSQKTIKKITGLYVPFWLINADCYANVAGLGYVQDDPTQRAVFNFKRKVLFKVKNVPFDGSFKISNFLMNSIEPFDFSELVNYDDTYLPGYYADRYDRNALDLTEVIDIRISQYAKQAGELAAKAKLGDEHKIYNKVEADASESYIKNLSQRYALLPLWFLNYEYKGESYQIAINGQTGKISGELPTTKKKRWLETIKATTPWVMGVIGSVLMFLICTILGVIAQGNKFDALSQLSYIIFYGGILLSISFIGVCARKVILAYKNVEYESYNPLKGAPDLYEYFDSSFKPEIVESSDEYMGVQFRTLESSDNGRGQKLSDWMWYGPIKN